MNLACVFSFYHFDLNCVVIEQTTKKMLKKYPA